MPQVMLYPMASESQNKKVGKPIINFMLQSLLSIDDNSAKQLYFFFFFKKKKKIIL